MKHIAGHVVMKPIHETAQSLIYRAVRAADGSPAILKILNEEYPSPGRLARFSREFEMARKAAGEGVIEAKALERHGNSALIVFEDFGGEPLQRPVAAGALDVAAALDVAEKAAAALERIHARDLIHKDVNPSNVLWNPATGELKIIDFGISTDLSREEPSAEALGAIEGTLSYIAPEQTGRMNRGTDYRADLYSLGATLYYLVTGRPPFPTVDALELLHCHLARQPVPPHEIDAEIPASLSAIIGKAMAKAPEDRYQSAAGLRADLARCREAFGRGATEVFELGRGDAQDRFLIPEKLYGREREIEALLAAFDRAAQGRCELLLVPGYSGVGKSSLIDEVHKPIAARRGHFIRGKFDQYRRDIPYSAVIPAFQQLVRQILGEGDAEVAAVRRRLLDALGPNARVVLDVIAEVELLVGEQPPVPELPPVEAQHRFGLVLRRFVGALAGEDRPLALTLDDLQWADSASLRLLEVIVSDGAIGHLLVIGAYRDNEVDAAHPLTVTLEALGRAGARVSSIALRPLGAEHVGELCADTLRAPLAEVTPLADLCLAKTGGNPFFLCRFLETLHAEGLVAFDRSRGAFRWSVAEIDRVGITDNVVELMAERIRRFPEAGRRLLEVAACLGNVFDLTTLALGHGRSRTETAADLRPALAAAVIVPTGAEYKFVTDGEDSVITYRFSHDRVQQAAYSLMSAEERAARHLSIGRLLSARLSAAEQRERAFEIVNHGNLGRELLTDQAERDQLARLNLEAGTRALGAAAYGPAFRYFSVGLALLGEGGWDRRYELAFGLTVRAANAASLDGDLEATERLVAEAVRRARTVLDRVRVYEAWIDAYTARGKLREALALGMEILAEIGVALPRRAGKAHAAAAVARLKLLLARRKVESLAELPAMTDPQKPAAVRIIAAIASAAYNIEPDLFPVVIVEQFRLSLAHGNAPESPFCYSAVAVICAGLFVDVPTAEALGLLAIRLAERPESRHIHPRCTWVHIQFVRPWNRPLREPVDELLDVYRRALEVGDVDYAGLAGVIRVAAMVYSAAPLVEANREANVMLSAMRGLRTARAILLLDLVHRMVRALTGELGELAEARFLGGDGADLIVRARAMRDLYAEGACRIHEMWLAYLAQDYEGARAAHEIALGFVEPTMGMTTQSLLYIYGALTELATLPEATGWARLRAHKRVFVARRKLVQWTKHAPMNFAHWVELLDAERARVSGDSARAREHYDRALTLARESRRVDAEALAAELAGRFYLGIGSARLAELHLRDAHHAYLRWGATAKVRDLEARYPTFLDRRSAEKGDGSQPLATIRTTMSTGSVSFDFLAVTQASQAISREVVLDDLLRTLMRVLLESAGAERGLLLVHGPPQLAVVTDPATGEIAVTRDEGAFEERADVAASILRYVRRTGERVVLEDAATEGAFMADPRVVARRLRSVLSMPVVQQQKVVGVLYLENNLARGAFTPARCQVLEILSGQAAISIANALLYETLEQRVNDRTAELSRAMERLKETQQQLVIKEKLASLGLLTSGIAHEIENPLNFINNFAESGVELTREAQEQLARQRERLDPDAAADLEDLLGELGIGASKIHAHGQRADRIVRSMLAHSRGARSGEAAAVDLNALVQQYVELARQGQRRQGGALDVEIACQLDEGAGAASIVAEEIGRVLLNLIENAVHSARGKKRSLGEPFAAAVTVTTRSLGDRVEVRVRDNGAGVPAAIRDKVFMPFFTTKPTGEGTGLGLSLSHQIVVEWHGGAIGFDSEEGQFAEFHVTLPRRRPDG